MAALIILAAAAAAIGGAGCAGSSGTEAAPAAAPNWPRYTAEGELLRPEKHEEWTFVGASLGLSYSDGAESSHPLFHNVLVQPEAFRAYRSTGKFPVGTTFVLAVHEAREAVTIQRRGKVEGDLVALEAAVKDPERFPDGWAYFDFGPRGQATSAKAEPSEDCHRCHLEHGADDNVFVQFYPILRRAREAASGQIETSQGAGAAALPVTGDR